MAQRTRIHTFAHFMSATHANDQVPGTGLATLYGQTATTPRKGACPAYVAPEAALTAPLTRTFNNFNT